MNSSTRQRIFLSVVFTGLIAAVGCVPKEQFVYIHVDNTTKQPYTVSVDGTELATIAPGSFDKVKAVTGERHITLKSNGRVLFDQVKTLQPSETFLVMRQFMLNPDKSARYASCRIQYDTRFQAMLTKAAAKAAHENANATRREYGKLVQDLKLHAYWDGWYEIPMQDLVLQAPPSEVSSSYQSNIEKSVFDRLSEREYKWLKQAVAEHNPSVRQLDMLWAFMFDRFYN